MTDLIHWLTPLGKDSFRRAWLARSVKSHQALFLVFQVKKGCASTCFSNDKVQTEACLPGGLAPSSIQAKRSTSPGHHMFVSSNHGCFTGIARTCTQACHPLAFALSRGLFSSVSSLFHVPKADFSTFLVSKCWSMLATPPPKGLVGTSMCLIASELLLDWFRPTGGVALDRVPCWLEIKGAVKDIPTRAQAFSAIMFNRE